MRKVSLIILAFVMNFPLVFMGQPLVKRQQPIALGPNPQLQQMIDEAMMAQSALPEPQPELLADGDTTKRRLPSLTPATPVPEPRKQVQEQSQATPASDTAVRTDLNTNVPQVSRPNPILNTNTVADDATEKEIDLSGTKYRVRVRPDGKFEYNDPDMGWSEMDDEESDLLKAAKTQLKPAADKFTLTPTPVKIKDTDYETFSIGEKNYAVDPDGNTFLYNPHARKLFETNDAPEHLKKYASDKRAQALQATQSQLEPEVNSRREKEFTGDALTQDPMYAERKKFYMDQLQKDVKNQFSSGDISVSDPTYGGRKGTATATKSGNSSTTTTDTTNALQENRLQTNIKGTRPTEADLEAIAHNNAYNDVQEAREKQRKFAISNDAYQVYQTYAQAVPKWYNENYYNMSPEERKANNPFTTMREMKSAFESGDEQKLGDIMRKMTGFMYDRSGDLGVQARQYLTQPPTKSDVADFARIGLPLAQREDSVSTTKQLGGATTTAPKAPSLGPQQPVRRLRIAVPNNPGADIGSAWANFTGAPLQYEEFKQFSDNFPDSIKSPRVPGKADEFVVPMKVFSNGQWVDRNMSPHMAYGISLKNMIVSKPENMRDFADAAYDALDTKFREQNAANKIADLTQAQKQTLTRVKNEVWTKLKQGKVELPAELRATGNGMISPLNNKILSKLGAEFWKQGGNAQGFYKMVDDGNTNKDDIQQSMNLLPVWFIGRLGDSR